MKNYGRRENTYTFYTDILGSSKIVGRAIHLRKWQGPIFSGKYQCIMCYDKPTLFKLLCMYREAEVNIYQRIQVGFNQFEYRILNGERLDDVIDNLYQEMNGFKRKFETPVPLNEVTRYTKGVKPSYSKGASKGNAGCARCGRCVCSLLRNNDMVTGWLRTTCECGDDVNYSEAHLYL